MEKSLGVCHDDYSSSPHARAMREFFLDLNGENLVWSLEVKPTKAWGPKTSVPRNFSFSCYSTLSLQQVIKIMLGVFLPVYGSSNFCSR